MSGIMRKRGAFPHEIVTWVHTSIAYWGAGNYEPGKPATRDELIACMEAIIHCNEFLQAWAAPSCWSQAAQRGLRSIAARPPEFAPFIVEEDSGGGFMVQMVPNDSYLP